ncbi:hypothetical protein MRX96_041895 [Rhipicephalus microplus]
MPVMVRQELNLIIAHSPEGGKGGGDGGSVNGASKPRSGGAAAARSTGSAPAAAGSTPPPAAAAAPATTNTPSGRTPNCARCKNHNKMVLLRGHKRFCPYVDCVCDRCKLIAKRQVVMAKQVALRRAQALDEAMGRTVIEEVDPEELKLAAENGSMPPADCVTPADPAPAVRALDQDAARRVALSRGGCSSRRWYSTATAFDDICRGTISAGSHDRATSSCRGRCKTAQAHTDHDDVGGRCRCSRGHEPSQIRHRGVAFRLRSRCHRGRRGRHGDHRCRRGDNQRCASVLERQLLLAVDSRTYPCLWLPSEKPVCKEGHEETFTVVEDSQPDLCVSHLALLITRPRFQDGCSMPVTSRSGGAGKSFPPFVPIS